MLNQIANQLSNPEGLTHEYYVTARYDGKIKGASKVNVNVANPDHGKRTPTPTKQPPQPAPKPKEQSAIFPGTSSVAARPAKEKKITHAYFVDMKGNPSNHLFVGQTVKIRIRTEEMINEWVEIVVWEYDRLKNDEIIRKRLLITGNSTDCVPFQITKEEVFEKGIDFSSGDNDSRQQQYFIEVIPVTTKAESVRFGLSDEGGSIQVDAEKSPAVVQQSKVEKQQAPAVTNKTDGIVTFQIYSDGRIEKHIPKVIAEEYKQKYKYVYHDKYRNEHEICIVNFILADTRENGSYINSIPKGYERTYSYPKGGNAQKAYVYANGDICVEGTQFGFRIYPKSTGQIELVRMKDSLNYSKDNVKVYYSFRSSQRRYCNPESYAGFLGALAELGREDVLCTGMCFEDATSYPSVTHPNGDSADTAYFSTSAEEQKKVNAFKLFHFRNIYRGKTGWYPNLKGTKYSKGHEDHLHAGDFDSSIVKILKI